MESQGGREYCKRHKSRLVGKEVKRQMQEIEARSLVLQDLVPQEVENCESTAAVEAGSLVDFGEHECWAAEEEELDSVRNVSSSESDNPDDVTEDGENLSEQLQEWACNPSIPRLAVTSLLKILKTHKCFSGLPSDYRSFLVTPRESKVVSVKPGEYIHLGLGSCVQKLLLACGSDDNLEIQINVDGLPIHRSTNTSFWPVLVSAKGTQSVEVAGIYCGISKPENVAEFLDESLKELKILLEDGVRNGDKISKVSLHSVIADAPARAFVLCVKNHTGYSSCTKCHVRGEWQRKVVFLDMCATPRTDESFRCQSDAEHHNGNSPFVNLPVDMIKSFPLEYMHLICLGVTRKLSYLWTRGKPAKYKLSRGQSELISSRLEALRSHTPMEFDRKPRGLQDLERWKATEYRQFLLYSGPVVLKDILQEDIYENFLTLHVATTILCNSQIYRKQNTYAHSLMEYFVRKFTAIYGTENVTTNVHGLLHIACDANSLGPLDTFSAFKFENKLGKLKALLRKPNQPLQQVHRRLQEINKRPNLKSKKENIPEKRTASHELLLPPYFKMITVKDFHLKCSSGDNVVTTTSGAILKIISIGTQDSQVAFVAREFKCKEDFYVSPCPSSSLGIFLVSKLGMEKLYACDSVKSKCYCMPIAEQIFVVFPVIHTE